jgi:hypothetical protein
VSEAPRESWEQVRQAIVEVFTGEWGKIARTGPALTHDVGGWQIGGGAAVACWLTIRHAGAEEPHLELTARVSGPPGAYRLSADVSVPDGDIPAELDLRDGPGLPLPEVAARLGEFLRDNAPLIERLATARPPGPA